MSFEEAESSNELEYCLLGGRSLWVGHQIKGSPTLLLTASVQVCNWTEQRAETLTLKKRFAGTVLTYLLLQSMAIYRTNRFCQQMICYITFISGVNIVLKYTIIQSLYLVN